jgi:hypothetical protein
VVVVVSTKPGQLQLGLLVALATGGIWYRLRHWPREPI